MKEERRFEVGDRVLIKDVKEFKDGLPSHIKRYMFKLLGDVATIRKIINFGDEVGYEMKELPGYCWNSKDIAGKIVSEELKED